MFELSFSYFKRIHRVFAGLFFLLCCNRTCTYWSQLPTWIFQIHRLAVNFIFSVAFDLEVRRQKLNQHQTGKPQSFTLHFRFRYVNSARRVSTVPVSCGGVSCHWRFLFSRNTSARVVWCCVVLHKWRICTNSMLTLFFTMRADQFRREVRDVCAIWK